MGILFANKAVVQLLSAHKELSAHHIVTVPSNSLVDERIANHTDLSVFVSAYVVVEPSVYDAVCHQLTKVKGTLWTKNKVVCGIASMSSEYPKDIAYNALLMKDHFFHLLKNTDKEIINRINGLKINVKQGYTRCSCLPIGTQAVITEDSQLASLLTQLGYEVLRIQKGFVDLPGYPHGFIGGSGGTVESKVVLNGALKYHPDGKAIHAFIIKQGYTIIELYDGQLKDCGSILYYSDKNEEASC